MNMIDHFFKEVNASPVYRVAPNSETTVKVLAVDATAW